MTKKQRIAALEREVIKLEARIAALELRPYLYWPVCPEPKPWTITWSDGDTGSLMQKSDGVMYVKCGEHSQALAD
jgi:hypothetical protein